MGAIGGMLGLSGGAGGSGFANPGMAGIQQPVTSNQVGESYKQGQDAIAQQNALMGALQAQNGIQNQSSVFNQLQGVANGTGPNPAQAMLNQQTGTNVANQAALMAGQRGAGANVGLMARQAGQQGGALQQQAVGQGATLQANQAMGAIGKMGEMANQQVANQMGATGANTQANQVMQQNLLNAMGNQNNALVGAQGSVNSANASLADTQMKGGQKMIGGIMNTASHGMANMDLGGEVEQKPKSPMSSFAQFLSGVGGMMSDGGLVDVVVSPGEKLVPPGKVDKAAGGKVEAKTVPGKAKVSGDDSANDTVKTKLPAGTIVVPRTKSGNEKDAANFVRSVLAKRGKK